VTRWLVIVGPTAVGKSALAFELATRLDAEIVNADALQIYRGLDIGTAKPSAEERRRVPHHLLDVVDPEERYSAGRFAREAGDVLRDLERRRRRGLIVGGSGLYLRALLDGLALLPEPDPEVRADLAARFEAGGLGPLRALLEELDPVTARRLPPGDAQRTLRALEVSIATGRRFSDWLAQPRPTPQWSTWRIGLTLPRRLLYDRIEERVQRMVDSGWLDEVRRLLASGVSSSAPGFQAIGYSDWIRHLEGEIDFETAVRRIRVATRRYAKRQETWFRRDPEIDWRDARRLDAWAAEIVERLED